MHSFIKKSLEELDHVVWPTNTESNKYMMYTIGTIVTMATLLAVVGYLIRWGLAGVRGTFEHTLPPATNQTVSGEDLVTDDDLKKIQDQIEERRKALSGAEIKVSGSGITASGVETQIITGTGN